MMLIKVLEKLILKISVIVYDYSFNYINAVIALRGDPLYTRTSTPKGWTVIGNAKESLTVNFILALKQQNLDILHSFSMRFLSRSLFSTVPKSQNWWRRHQNFSPKLSPLSSLISYGVLLTDIINRGDAVDVKTTVNVASNFFETKFFKFSHESGKVLSVQVEHIPSQKS
jgi:hypothetical protein